MKVLVVGYYGAGNCGDELILYSLVRLLEELDPQATVTALSFDPEATRRDHGIDALLRAPAGLAWLHPSHWLRIARAVRRSDLVLVGGGGLLEDIHNFGSIPMHLLPASIALLMGKPVAGVGLGVGPILTRLSRLLVGLVARHMYPIMVRDEGSLRELVACGVPEASLILGRDLALGLYPPVRAHRAQRPPKIGVALGPATWLSLDLAGLATALTVAVRRLGASLPVVFPTSYTAHDRAVVLRLAEELEGQGTHCLLDLDRRHPADLVAFMGGFDVVVAGKLHALLAAFQAGVPVVALSYAPKVSAAAEQLGIPVHPVDDIEPQALVRDILKAYESGQGGRDPYQVLREEVRGLVRDSFGRTLSLAGQRPPRRSHLKLLGDNLMFWTLVPLSLSRQLARRLQGERAWVAARSSEREGEVEIC